MKTIGYITPEMAALVGITLNKPEPVFLGQSNIAHMQAKHPADYTKYGVDISKIIAAPDYIGLNAKDDSFELVKEYVMNGEYVKVAVRVSGSGKYFARSLYVLNNSRVKNYIAKGTLKPTT